MVTLALITIALILNGTVLAIAVPKHAPLGMVIIFLGLFVWIFGLYARSL